jgi:hypothetical protein
VLDIETKHMLVIVSQQAMEPAGGAEQVFWQSASMLHIGTQPVSPEDDAPVVVVWLVEPPVPVVRLPVLVVAPGPVVDGPVVAPPVPLPVVPPVPLPVPVV